MNSADAWAILGIDPTEETRAIRIAYSAKLKSIDPEADPQAFIVLREAFEKARAEAAWAGAGAEPVRIENNAEPPDYASKAPAPTSDRPVEADPVTVHARSLSAILYGDHDGLGLGDAAREAALAHWSAIVADPRMEEIGFFGDVEQWAAEIIADTAPRSSPLIVPATRLFGWLQHDGTIRQGQAAAEVVRLYWLRGIVEAATRPGDCRHSAWIELTTRAYPGSNRGRADPLAVYELITAARQASPEIAAKFDPLRVALWKNNTAAPDSYESRFARGEIARPAYFRWIFIGWIGLSLVMGLVRAIGGG